MSRPERAPQNCDRRQHEHHPQSNLPLSPGFISVYPDVTAGSERQPFVIRFEPAPTVVAAKLGAGAKPMLKATIPAIAKPVLGNRAAAAT